MSTVKDMYANTDDIIDEWIEKLFPSDGFGCINFGYWSGINYPLSKEKRLASQKNLYFKLFQNFEKDTHEILEVGCGRGHGINWLAEKGYHPSGVDVLESQIIKAKVQYPGLSDCFTVGEAESLPYSDNQFDCVFSLEAAQHFISFSEFCKEAYRVLKPNGILIVSTFFFENHDAIKKSRRLIPDDLEGTHNALPIGNAIESIRLSKFGKNPRIERIGDDVFSYYSNWQKTQLGDTPLNKLSQKRLRWKEYYTGGGKKEHPWVLAYKDMLLDYFIIVARKDL